MTEYIPLYHNFFIHSFVDGHLGSFHVLAIVNSAAVNIAAAASRFSRVRLYVIL